MSSPYLDEKPYTDRVRALNDQFRKTFESGRVLVTQGIASLAPELQERILCGVRSFDSFDEANDPWHEHDFGKIDIDGHTILFKIDYYDRALQTASPNPAKSDLTTRVLTIMQAEEY